MVDLEIGMLTIFEMSCKGTSLNCLEARRMYLSSRVVVFLGRGGGGLWPMNVSNV